MQGFDGVGQVGEKLVKGHFECAASRQYDVIIIWICARQGRLNYRMAEAPPDAIAFDGVAHFFGDCETKPWADMPLRR